MDNITWEMNQKGQHRITAGEEVGDWAMYRSLATLEVGDTCFVAGTEYGLLPKSEQVYELHERNTFKSSNLTPHQRFGPGHGTSLSGVTTSECNCSVGADHY